MVATQPDTSTARRPSLRAMARHRAHDHGHLCPRDDTRSPHFRITPATMGVVTAISVLGDVRYREGVGHTARWTTSSIRIATRTLSGSVYAAGAACAWVHPAIGCGGIGATTSREQLHPLHTALLRRTQPLQNRDVRGRASMLWDQSQRSGDTSRWPAGWRARSMPSHQPMPAHTCGPPCTGCQR